MLSRTKKKSNSDQKRSVLSTNFVNRNRYPRAGQERLTKRPKRPQAKMNMLMLLPWMLLGLLLLVYLHREKIRYTVFQLKHYY